MRNDELTACRISRRTCLPFILSLIFILPRLSMLFLLILACVIPSMVVCWAAAFAVRRLGPRWGLVDRPGHRKIHAAPMPTSGGLAIWLGIVLPLAVGQVALWGLPEIGRQASAGDSSTVAFARLAASVGQALGTAGRRHRADAAGAGRRSPRARLAAAIGRANRRGRRAGFAGLADEPVSRLAQHALDHRRAERALDRRAGELVQHARQHGRAVGRRGGHRRGHVGRHDAVDAIGPTTTSRNCSSPASCW